MSVIASRTLRSDRCDDVSSADVPNMKAALVSASTDATAKVTPVVTKETATVDDCVVVVPEALVPFGKTRKPKFAKVSTVRQQVAQGLAELGEAAFRATLVARLEKADEQMKEIAAAGTTKDTAINEQMAAYEKAKAVVLEFIESELAAARAHREATETQKASGAKLEGLMQKKLEAEKKVAMLEVMKANKEKMRELQEQREAALKAVQEFKKQLAEQKQQQKRSFNEVAKQHAPDKESPSKVPRGSDENCENADSAAGEPDNSSK